MLILTDGQPADIDTKRMASADRRCAAGGERNWIGRALPYCINLDPKADEYVATFSGASTPSSTTSSNCRKNYPSYSFH